MPIFADRECHVVSVKDPYGRLLGFLDRNSWLTENVRNVIAISEKFIGVLSPQLIHNTES
jgi:hypothetical protein